LWWSIQTTAWYLDMVRVSLDLMHREMTPDGSTLP
jgi:hypothetical protein